MKIIVSILLALAVLAGITFFVTRYPSAFEADQACHYELTLQNEGSVKYGCDHDLETRQWLLFKSGENTQPSQVVRRFRY